MGSPVLHRALEAVHHLQDPEPPWRDILLRSSELMNCDGGALVMFGGTGELVEVQQIGADPEAERDYVQHFHALDILRDHGARRPLGSWLDSEIILPSAAQRERNAYYVDFMCKYRMRQMLCFIVDDSGRSTTTISFQRGIAADSHAFLGSAPIIEFSTALQAALARRRSAASLWFATIEGAFAAFGDAACLLDASGRVLRTSALFEQVIEKRRALKLRDGQLWHAVPQVRRMLSGMLSRAVRGDGAYSLVVPAECGQSCKVEVIRAAHTEMMGCRPLLLLRIRSTGTEPLFRAEMLALRFNLTDAESRVLTALADGLTAPQFAVDFGLSINTVRKQIASLMEKTGCNRQSDLVRLTS